MKKVFGIWLFGFLVVQLFSYSAFADSPEIKNLIFARRLEKGGYAATREFKSFEQINLFVTLEKVKGKHQATVEWYNPRGNLEASYSTDFESRYLHFWLILPQEDPASRFLQRDPDKYKGRWKVKIYFNDRFIREEKFWVK